MQIQKQLVSIREASEWASNLLKRSVSESNISYLIQYGKIRKHNGNNATLVDLNDLKNYYNSYRGHRETTWKKLFGEDLNWKLSFDNLREKETTKHVHRLHPYKGKFIPQLVEYFIDDHIDKYKKDVFFKKKDIILDPFSGSGTTLVQANELGIHSVGVDISQFNCMISNVKLNTYDLKSLPLEMTKLIKKLLIYENDSKILYFELELLQQLNKFNNKYFPSPEYKYQLQKKKINEDTYSNVKEKQFISIFNNLISKYKIELNQEKSNNFIEKWYFKNVRKEIDFIFKEIKKIKDKDNKKLIALILSRTIRSCRATTHSDLATLKYPQLSTYYCYKHKKICKPIFSIKGWFERYMKDALTRLEEFSNLKTQSYSMAIPGDSRNINIFEEIRRRDENFFKLIRKEKIKGIFTSPPYVGQIDYHEQHAYAYDLLGFKREDDLEIGPLYKGQGESARKSYIRGISDVLINSMKYLSKNFDIFLVANDKYNLYPTIAQNAGLYIAKKFKRPVLNRTERDKSPYSEIIFHLKKRSNGNSTK